MNEELLASAVSFLRDPGVASSPLNKKIEFLQSKGLNEQEIEEAMKRASAEPASSASLSTSATATGPTTYQAASQNSVPPPLPYDYYGLAPPMPERSWKDYFIMATATAGVAYGVYQVFTRYLLPSIIPPGQSRVNKDKASIEEEFLRIDKVLEQMAQEQKDVRDANDAKLKDIDATIATVNDFVARYNKEKLKFDDDLRLMKLEVDSLHNFIEKNLKLTNDNIHADVENIVDELYSLKNFIKARVGAASGPDRLVPVSSIPSASEILKKVKSGSGAPNSAELAGEAAKRKSGDAKDNVLAAPDSSSLSAGIPDWQLAHKKQEEENVKSPDPAAVLQASSASLADEDQAVASSIKKVSVPAWQLAAGT